ncbi:hypothetical protein PENTCL1PPCAC_25979 [Pristionchus entomophagus]|uniref:Phosphoacetylglucosamine mutase n=1 Tax=Pristionchus entomophagus TaxID=358040 RepID=A0AAV5UBU9_9BILA|nr:hypothetical protein PENTCL1PPCAC_25979 [Pristionchus entomophagus]
MADLIPVVVPPQFTREGNTNHLHEHKPILVGRPYSYGTAGFREHADQLPFILYRIGYLASLRARTTGKAIGVMITASHNPEQDNGVKIIDPDGEMLAEEWETYATELVNASDEEFPTAVRALETQLNDPPLGSTGSIVVCGRDTRASGQLLTQAARAGATLFRTQFEDRGLVTTPQLHYIVYVLNHASFGPAGEEGYYRHHALTFKELFDKLSKSLTNYTPKLHLDCANGIGAQKMRKLERKLPNGALNIHFRNETGVLNHECGADIVKISHKAPAGFEDVPVNERCAVFDGDADRLVYFYKKEDGQIELLDGDKIALLIAKFYKEHLSSLGLEDECTFACVQTAYANGNSTRYLEEELGITPICVPTGVKHLHHEAAKYDCAIYFEANGHGTVTYSDRFYELLERSDSEAAFRLRVMSRLINKIVGDAMADLLAVELILRHYDWSVQEWAAMYEDAPNKQIKITVFDRAAFITTKDEQKLIQPGSLQVLIDEAVKRRGEKARAFVRPSGTENIVRVYAEAASQADADLLAAEIARATDDYKDCDSDS